MDKKYPVFFATVMGETYKNDLLNHKLCSFTSYDAVGSDLEFCVKGYTKKAHFSTEGYHFLMIFLKNAGFRMWPPSMDTVVFFFLLNC